MHFFHHYSVFFYADYGILYEELLVRAKKNTSRVAYNSHTDAHVERSKVKNFKKFKFSCLMIVSHE